MLLQRMSTCCAIASPPPPSSGSLAHSCFSRLSRLTRALLPTFPCCLASDCLQPQKEKVTLNLTVCSASSRRLPPSGAASVCLLLPLPCLSLSLSFAFACNSRGRQTQRRSSARDLEAHSHTQPLPPSLSHLFPTLVCMCASVLTPGSRERQNVCESVDPVCPDAHQHQRRRRRRQQQQE